MDESGPMDDPGPAADSGSVDAPGSAGGPGSVDDHGPVRWRRDASTSFTVRLLWTLGAGTFLAAIALMASARVFALAGETTSRSAVDPFTTGQLVVVAALLAVAVAILALSLAHRLGVRIPFGPDEDGSLERALDAGVGAVVMGALIVVFARGVAEYGDMLAAATIPLALVAIAVSVFLRSTGTLDVDEGVLYLHEPEDAIELDLLDGVSARYVGDTAIVKLSYRQPDNQYVPGPRRLVLPPGVARDLEVVVGSN